MSRSLIWLGLFIGSTVGSLVPEAWGADLFSFSSILCSAIGGIGGIWLGYHISRDY